MSLKSIAKTMLNPIKATKSSLKVFKSALGEVGKVLNTKWGKMLMLAAIIFTGGMAIAGAVAAYGAAAAAGQSFMASFVAGAKGFMVALASPIGQAKSMLGSMQAGTGVLGLKGAAAASKVAAAGAQAGSAAQVAGAAGETVAGSPAALLEAGGGSAAAQTTAAIEGSGTAIADIGGSTAGLAQPAAGAGVTPIAGTPGAMVANVPTAASKPALFGSQVTAGAPAGAMSGVNAGVTAVPKVGIGGMLKGAAAKIPSAMGKFASSTGGGLMLSQAASGYAAAKSAEKINERNIAQDRWYEDQWANTNLFDDRDYSVTAPGAGPAGHRIPSTSRVPYSNATGAIQ